MAGFLEKTLRSGADILERSLTVESWSRRRGLLQKADPRLKILMLIALVLLCSLARSYVHLAILYLAALLLAISSRIDPIFFTKRVWIFIPAFSGLIALPALVLTPGSPLFSIGPLTVTREGSMAAAFLVLRVSSSVSFTLLFVLTTPWNEAMKALRSLLPVPAPVDKDPFRTACGKKEPGRRADTAPQGDGFCLEERRVPVPSIALSRRGCTYGDDLERVYGRSIAGRKGKSW